MKKILLFFLFIFFIIGFISPAQAHFLTSSGPIGSLLHIDPDDDPIIGQKSTLELEFKDTQNRFQLSKCACNLSISMDGKELLSKALAVDSMSQSETNTSLEFIFPEKAIYTIRIVGKPASQGAFQPFDISYDFRVAREPGGQATTHEEDLMDGSQSASMIRQQPKNQGIVYAVPLFVGALIILILLVWTFTRSKAAKRAPTPPQQPPSSLASAGQPISTTNVSRVENLPEGGE